MPPQDEIYTFAGEIGALRQAIESLTGAVGELKADVGRQVSDLKTDMGRRMEGFDLALKELVTKEAFEAERLRVNQEMGHIKESVQAEKEARQSMSTFQRWIVGVLVPTVIGLAGLAINAFSH
jgi:hypothetical protein